MRRNYGVVDWLNLRVLLNMSQIRVCIECGDEFDLHSPEKRRAGGKITHCPDCSEESTVRYLGVQNAAGKQSGCEILSFDSVKDRENYKHFWQNNSGLFSAAICQMGRLMNDPGIPFRKVAENRPNENHKGKG